MVESTKFIFGIKNFLLIGTINLDMLLEMIIFLFVLVNIPFLFYFAEIDNLGAFFNNLTNKII